MKKTFLFFTALLFFVLRGNAQMGTSPYTLTVASSSVQKMQAPVAAAPQLPQKTNTANRLINTNSVTQYGTDIIIKPDTTKDQRNVKVATAYNGWIYAAFTIDTLSGGGIVIRKSVDGGFTWTDFINTGIFSGINYPAIDLTVAGTDTANLVVFLAGVYHNQTSSVYNVWLDRYHGTNGAFIDEKINETNNTFKIYDVAVTTDYRHPSISSAPFSVALVYSKLSPSDSVIYLASVDGGTNYNTREGVFATLNYCGKVAVAYGKGANYSNGRYFLAFERRLSTGAVFGNILFTHTTNDPTSAFQIPIYIDSINGTMTNLMCHPRIACSNSGIDNDSGNISTVVVADRYWSAVDYDVLGLYSLNSVYSALPNWHTSALASSGNYETEGDIVFNDSDQFFYATLFDSTLYNITSTHTDFNNITGWTIDNVQYNNQSNNVVHPYPHLSINPVSSSANFVWNSQNSNGTGIALFDAQDNPTGIPAAENKYDFLSPYPNPSNGIINFKYILKSNENVQLSIMNLMGQEIISVTEFRMQSAGSYTVPVDFSNLPNGVYVFRFIAGNEIKTGNLVIVR